MQLVRTDDFETVRSKYIEIIEKTPGIREHACWIYGWHPSDASLKAYVDDREMCLLMDGDRVAGLVAIVLHQDADYEPVAWAEPLPNDEAAVLHLLAVCPDYRGKGVGRILVEKAVEQVRKSGKKAVRLDTLKSNLPAQRLYESTGFSFRGTRHAQAEGTVWFDFYYYEKVLE